MTLTSVIIDRIVEDYVHELNRLLPSSSASRLDTPPPTAFMVDDTRLLRLLNLSKKYASLLRYCSELEARVLLLRVCGRIFMPVYQRIGYTRIQTDGTARPLSAYEISKHLGITPSQYRRELSSARDHVAIAVRDVARATDREGARASA